MLDSTKTTEVTFQYNIDELYFLSIAFNIFSDHFVHVNPKYQYQKTEVHQNQIALILHN